MKIQLFVSIFLFSSTCIYAQQADSLLSKTDRIVSFSNRFFSQIQKKSASLNSSLDRQTEKYLQRLQRKEKKFRPALSRREIPGENAPSEMVEVEPEGTLMRVGYAGTNAFGTGGGVQYQDMERIPESSFSSPTLLPTPMYQRRRWGRLI